MVLVIFVLGTISDEVFPGSSAVVSWRVKGFHDSIGAREVYDTTHNWDHFVLVVGHVFTACKRQHARWCVLDVRTLSAELVIRHS